MGAANSLNIRNSSFDMMKSAVLSATLTVTLGLGAAFAQEAQRDTGDRFVPDGRTAEALGLKVDPNNNSYAPESPGDSDIGDQLLLLPATDYKALTFYGGVEGLWTNNAAYTESDTFEDFYLNFGAGATFMPRLVNNLYGEVSADYDWYRYADHSELDFDRLDARAGLINVFPGLGDLSAWARYQYTRLTEGSDELFTDHALELGLFKPLPFRRDHFFYLGAYSAFSFQAGPSYARRHSHSLIIGHRYTPIDKLEMGLHYRFSIYDYVHSSRTDLNHELGAAIDYRFTDSLTFRLSGTYRINDSNLSGADYEVGNAGAAAGFIWKL